MNKKIIVHFKTVDQDLHSLISSNPKAFTWGPEKSKDYFVSLCREIIGQQLSGKAAGAIYARFEALFPKKKITAQALSELSDETIRSIGTSWAKVSFLKDLAKKVQDKEIDLTRLDTLSNDEVLTTLTKIKGIGPWTAEMFLMFGLGREDIFSFGDLGLKKAIMKLYKLKKEPSKKRLELLTKKWSPYRTYAACILWQSLEL